MYCCEMFVRVVLLICARVISKTVFTSIDFTWLLAFILCVHSVKYFLESCCWLAREWTLKVCVHPLIVHYCWLARACFLRVCALPLIVHYCAFCNNVHTLITLNILIIDQSFAKNYSLVTNSLSMNSDLLF